MKINFTGKLACIEEISGIKKKYFDFLVNDKDLIRCCLCVDLVNNRTDKELVTGKDYDILANLKMRCFKNKFGKDIATNELRILEIKEIAQ